MPPISSHVERRSSVPGTLPARHSQASNEDVSCCRTIRCSRAGYFCNWVIRKRVQGHSGLGLKEMVQPDMGLGKSLNIWLTLEGQNTKKHPLRHRTDQNLILIRASLAHYFLPFLGSVPTINQPLLWASFIASSGYQLWFPSARITLSMHPFIAIHSPHLLPDIRPPPP